VLTVVHVGRERVNWKLRLTSIYQSFLTHSWSNGKSDC